LCHLDKDFRSSLPEVQAKKIDIICCIFRRRIQMTGMDPVIAQPYNDQGSCDKYCLDYCPEALLEQPNNSFNRLSSFVAAAKASMQLSAVLPMGGSAITSTSQPVPC
jgi:hypothetical protein